MRRKAVDSSMLTSIGYDPTSRTLELEYKNADVWQYLDIPPEESDALMQAQSHGACIRENIVGSYHESKVLSAGKRR